MMTTVPVPRELILASASPRRRELLAVLGVEFTVAPAEIDETVLPGEGPEDYVRRMAAGKACAGWEQAGRREVAVLGSDTAVVVAGQILGKPGDRDGALAMLGALSGRTHAVLSAVTLLDPAGEVSAMSRTEVTMRVITEAEALAYWQTGEPCDKAGAYGIQGLGAMFVANVQGSYSGVVGLPLFETAQLLGARGFRLLAGA